MPTPAHDPTSEATAADRGRADEVRSSWRSWAAVVVLGLGIFTLVTIEELPIGVLTLVSQDLGVSEGIVGLSVTLPGLLAGVIALLAPVVARNADRRLILVGSLAAIVLSCALSMMSSSIGGLLASRIFTGIAIGLYWPMLPVVATRQVPPARAALALSVSFAGVGSAVVLGVPFASWVGAMLGWREAFAVVGAIALVVMIAVLLLVRPVRSQEATRLADLVTGFRLRGVRYAVIIAALVVTGQFITYAYVSPLLQGTAGLDVLEVPAMLLAFGLAGLVGNFAITPLLSRSVGLSAAVVSIGMALSLGLVLTLAHAYLSSLVLMTLWGLFAGSLSVVMQTFVTRFAGRYEEAATALNSTTFNIAIAMGALTGGRIVDAVGIRSLAVVSIVMIAAGGALAVRWLVTGGPRDMAAA